MALAGISISQSPAASDVAEAMPSAEPQPKGFGRRVPAKINTAQGAPRRLWAAACALMMGTKKCEGDEKGKHPKYEPSADCDQEDAYGTDQDTVSTASASVSGDSGPEDSGFSGDSGSEDSDVGSDREDGEAFIRQASHGSTVAQPEEVRDEAPPVSPVAAPVQYGRNALLRWRHAAGTAEASENDTGIIVQAAPAVPVPLPPPTRRRLLQRQDLRRQLQRRGDPVASAARGPRRLPLPAPPRRRHLHPRRAPGLPSSVGNGRRRAALTPMTPRSFAA